MTIKTPAEIKAKFETGKTPTYQDFVDLIDSHLSDLLGDFPNPLPAVDGSALLNIGSALPDPLPARDGSQLTNINPQEYNLPAGMPVPSYATANTFVLTGDYTVGAATVANRVFLIGRRLELTIAGVLTYTEVLAAAFAAGITTVTLLDAMASSQLTAVKAGVIRPVNNGGAVSQGVLNVTTEAYGTNNTRLATTAFVQQAGTRGALAGLGLSTAGASTTMSIAAGTCRDSTNTDWMSLNAFSKSTTAWGLGTATGGLDTGTIANSTWYHFFVIKRPDTGVVDVIISLSPTAPTLPANYTLFRRIGSGKTNGSGQWTAFTQDGDYFIWAASVLDISANNPGTAAVTRTLVSVPTGVNVEAHFQGILNNSGASGAVCYFSDLAQNDEVPDYASFTDLCAAGTAADQVRTAASRLRVRTNTSAQIRSRLHYSDANITLYIRTLGWYDTRGRNA